MIGCHLTVVKSSVAETIYLWRFEFFLNFLEIFLSSEVEMSQLEAVALRTKEHVALPSSDMASTPAHALRVLLSSGVWVLLQDR